MARMPDKLILDGYNVIYASDELAGLMEEDTEAAREKLLTMVEEHCFRKGCSALVVFDAGGRVGPAPREERSAFLEVAYTAKGQSADSYIEKLAYRTGERAAAGILLVTGDYDQQKVASGAGLLRMSSREFLLEMGESKAEALERARVESGRPRRVRIAERLSEEEKAALERFKKQQ